MEIKSFCPMSINDFVEIENVYIENLLSYFNEIGNIAESKNSYFELKLNMSKDEFFDFLEDFILTHRNSGFDINQVFVISNNEAFNTYFTQLSEIVKNHPYKKLSYYTHKPTYIFNPFEETTLQVDNLYNMEYLSIEFYSPKEKKVRKGEKYHLPLKFIYIEKSNSLQADSQIDESLGLLDNYNFIVLQNYKNEEIYFKCLLSK